MKWWTATLIDQDRLRVSVRWHARRFGGLFVGVRLVYPCCVEYEDGSLRRCSDLSVGLLVATLTVEWTTPVAR